MNIKSFLMVLASGAILVLTACDGETTSTGAGGSNAGNGGAGGEASSSSSGGGTGGMAGTGGAGGTMCLTCGDLITNGVPGKDVACPGKSMDALVAYMGCVCDPAMGNCATDCDGYCAAMPKPNTDQAKCDACLTPINTGNGVCNTVFSTCANDI